MKDFAGSSITYYGLAREKMMNKYPRLISVLMILALICMTGLAIYLISDLVSFASNPDHKGVPVGLDLKGPENSIISMTNISENSSQALGNLSRQIKEPNSANLSQINASLPSSQAAKGVVAASKSSSSISPVKKHHSSSSSSSVKSAKKSNDKNNLTEEGNSSNNKISTNGSLNNSQGSNDSEVETTAIPASLPSIALVGITNPTGDTSTGEHVAIIQFKTDTPSSSKSEKTVLDNANNVQKTSSQKSKVTASSQSQKAQEARAKQTANRNQIAENMKKRAAQSRTRTASK
ncbi:MAG: hypothetical protein NTU95_00780 [Methanothrix sp.]|nr:hypothetical protein [Methanothrix sp.]